MRKKRRQRKGGHGIREGETRLQRPAGSGMAGWEEEAAGKERRREGEAPALGFWRRAP